MTARFQAEQARLAAYLRTPATAPPPMSSERAAVYADPVYRNLEGVLSSGFPVLKRLSSDAEWTTRVRAFLHDHRCTPAEFHRAAGCFVDHCLTRAHSGTEYDGRVAELAHYEWVEMVLAIAADRVDFSIAPQPDTLLTLSPLAAVLTYRYPVHRWSAPQHLMEGSPEPSFFVVRRQRDDRVRFMAVNALSWELLERLRLSPAAGWSGAVEAFAMRYPHLATALVEQSAALKQQFIDADVLVPSAALRDVPYFDDEDPHLRLPLALALALAQRNTDIVLI